MSTLLKALASIPVFLLLLVVVSHIEVANTASFSFAISLVKLAILGSVSFAVIKNPFARNGWVLFALILLVYVEAIDLLRIVSEHSKFFHNFGGSSNDPDGYKRFFSSLFWFLCMPFLLVGGLSDTISRRGDARNGRPLPAVVLWPHVLLGVILSALFLTYVLAS